MRSCGRFVARRGADVNPAGASSARMAKIQDGPCLTEQICFSRTYIPIIKELGCSACVGLYRESIMDVAEAVSTAKNHIKKLFAEEGIQNLGLEEASFDEGHEIWQITLGFSRPWDNPQGVLNQLTANPLKRFYKVVSISDKDNKVLSVKNYPI